VEKFILYVCNEDGSTSPIGEFSTESEAMEACIDENAIYSLERKNDFGSTVIF
jgi:hypothetical protein